MNRVLPAVLLAAAGCDDAICEGPACAAFAGECDQTRIGLEHRWSALTDESANPESVAFVPGEPGRALVTSANANRLSELTYDEDELAFARQVAIEPGNSTSVVNSFSISPRGGFAVVAVADLGDGACDGEEDCPGGTCSDGRCVCYPDALPGCACGLLLFVDVRAGPGFGDELGRIGVGYTPDSATFSSDGAWLVSADEDDAEELACKPPDRVGGSVSLVRIGDLDGGGCETPLIDLGGSRACRVRQIPVTHERFSEPEQATVTTGGEIVIAIQETDELAFATPAGQVEVVALTPGAGPDGLALSADGELAAVAYEDGDALAVVDVAARVVIDERAVGPDVPVTYNRDLRDSARVHEPEQVAWFESQGAEFLTVTLQESHALVAYQFDRAARQLSFDSIAPVGADFADEMGGTAASAIGPEGLTATTTSAGRLLFLTANEREGSVTLVRSTCP